MPGTIMHLTLAQMVYRGINELNLDKTEFLCGNILPDEALDKSASHYRVPSSVVGYMLPDMKVVEKELFSLDEPYKLGAFCHLYFDYHFFEDFLFPMFEWNSEKDLVISKINGKCWTKNQFWSRSVFYSSYGELNHPIIKSGLTSLDEIYKMPEVLPDIGDSRFDIRREKNWKKELYEFIESEIEYTGVILELDKTVELMKKIANDLIRIINEARK